MQKPQYGLMYNLEERHFYFLAKREYIKNVLPVSCKRLKILDIGCGTGGLSKYLEKWGDVVRLESSSYAWPYLDKRKLTYLRIPVEKYKFPKKKFDAVFILDVLYHKNIKSPESVIRNAYQSLKSGGMLIVTDCAIPFLHSFHDTEMMAKKRFYLSEIASLVEKSGFIIEKKSYVFFLIFPLFAVTRIINKFRKFATVADLPYPINNFLLNICKAEAFLLRYMVFPIGSSVIIKGRKYD